MIFLFYYILDFYLVISLYFHFVQQFHLHFQCHQKQINQFYILVTFFDDIKIEKSGVEILEELPAENTTDSILGAEVVVVGGRGVLEDDNFELLEKFAEKVGGAIGGTRPMVDSEMIPFNHQIGQTGLTIRPKICISFGVSGAIQHTEGIKDTNLYVAVNTDENAAIFGVADYGIQADLKEILENYLTL